MFKDSEASSRWLKICKFPITISEEPKVYCGVAYHEASITAITDTGASKEFVFGTTSTLIRADQKNDVGVLKFLREYLSDQLYPQLRGWRIYLPGDKEYDRVDATKKIIARNKQVIKLEVNRESWQEFMLTHQTDEVKVVKLPGFSEPLRPSEAKPKIAPFVQDLLDDIQYSRFSNIYTSVCSGWSVNHAMTAHLKMIGAPNPENNISPSNMTFITKYMLALYSKKTASVKMTPEDMKAKTRHTVPVEASSGVYTSVPRPSDGWSDGSTGVKVKGGQKLPNGVAIESIIDFTKQLIDLLSDKALQPAAVQFLSRLIFVHDMRMKKEVHAFTAEELASSEWKQRLFAAYNKILATMQRSCSPGNSDEFKGNSFVGISWAHGGAQFLCDHFGFTSKYSQDHADEYEWVEFDIKNHDKGFKQRVQLFCFLMKFVVLILKDDDGTFAPVALMMVITYLKEVLTYHTYHGVHIKVKGQLISGEPDTSKKGSYATQLIWCLLAVSAHTAMIKDGKVELAKQFMYDYLLGIPSFFDSQVTDANRDELKCRRINVCIYSDDTVGKMPKKYKEYYNIERLRMELRNTGWDAKDIEIYPTLYTTFKKVERTFIFKSRTSFLPGEDTPESTGLKGREEVDDGELRTITISCREIVQRGPKFLQMLMTLMVLKNKNGTRRVVVVPYRDSPNIFAKMFMKADTYKTANGVFQAVTPQSLLVKIASVAMSVGTNEEVYQIGKILYGEIQKRMGWTDAQRENILRNLATPAHLANTVQRNIWYRASYDPELFVKYPTYESIVKLYLPTRADEYSYAKINRDRT